jgi:hypothetical protein
MMASTINRLICVKSKKKSKDIPVPGRGGP